jgi:hypothetical protein
MMSSARFAVGIAIGAGMGVATGNFGVWLALGVAIGFALAAAGQNRPKSEG